MNMIRIGNKLIDIARTKREIEQILNLRSRGLSQKEVAQQFELDRTFISRLENLGEIRKGKKIALIAFPIKNKQELISLAQDQGLEYVLVMNEEERWDFVEKKSGVELFNEVMDIIAKLSTFDIVIFAGSDMRIPLVERIIDTQVISICLGNSPIREDKLLPRTRLKEIISTVRNKP